MKVMGKEYKILQLTGGPEAGKYALFNRDVYSQQYNNGTHVTGYFTNTDDNVSDKYFDSELLAQEYINSLEDKYEKEK